MVKNLEPSREWDLKSAIPLGTRIRKTFYGLVTTLILVGFLSGLLLSVIALNVWAWRRIVDMGW